MLVGSYKHKLKHLQGDDTMTLTKHERACVTVDQFLETVRNVCAAHPNYRNPIREDGSGCAYRRTAYGPDQTTCMCLIGYVLIVEYGIGYSEGWDNPDDLTGMTAGSLMHALGFAREVCDVANDVQGEADSYETMKVKGPRTPWRDAWNAYVCANGGKLLAT